MASVGNTLICAALALALYGGIGLALACRVFGRAFGLWLAPAIGWAMHSALALPLLQLAGFNRLTVAASFVVFAIPALAFVRNDSGRDAMPKMPALLLAGTFLGVILIALNLVAVGWPKDTAQGLTLAPAIFDHSKIAMIDEMTRFGVPPGNPFFGGEGPPRLAYYYLWHFSAASLSLLTGFSGWEADSGMSGFTGIAALAAMIGLALRLSGQSAAALWVVVLAMTASARPVLDAIFGWESVQKIAGVPSGLGGFLFQTFWAPQHTMGALVAVIAIAALVILIERPRLLTAGLLGLLMAASFQSSTWIGGVAFPLMAAPVAIVMWLYTPSNARLRIIGYVAVAVLVALALIAPFLFDQSQTAALRNEGSPIAVEVLGILDDSITAAIGTFWNVPAYWLLYLPVELPAIYFAGIAGLVWLVRSGIGESRSGGERRNMAVAFAIAALTSLVCGSLLVSTLGENNDLGWRAVLPAVLILIVAAAVFLTHLVSVRRSVAVACAAVLIVVGLIDGLLLGYGNVVVPANASSRTFASSKELWQAVRRLTPPQERVANNPLYLADATPWPVNISWALMANRRSCFAGRELVRPFSALAAQRVDDLQTQFERIFAGNAQAGDIAQLAAQYSCDTAVVVPSDGAWLRDPFAAGTLYKLVEETPNWRIYRRAVR